MKSEKTLDAELIAYLKQEVCDLLDAGRVGLYEFRWILKAEAPELSDEAMFELAAEVLRQLLVANEARLVWEKWADPSYTREAGDVLVTKEHFADLTDEPYLAIEPTEGVVTQS